MFYLWSSRKTGLNPEQGKACSLLTLSGGGFLPHHVTIGLFIGLFFIGLASSFYHYHFFTLCFNLVRSEKIRRRKTASRLHVMFLRSLRTHDIVVILRLTTWKTVLLSKCGGVRSKREDVHFSRSEQFDHLYQTVTLLHPHEEAFKQPKQKNKRLGWVKFGNIISWLTVSVNIKTNKSLAHEEDSLDRWWMSN